MKLSIAVTSIAALVFPRNVVGQYGSFGPPVGYCDPTLPCETTMLSCPCATGSSVPSVGKSGKSSSLSGICGTNYVPEFPGPAAAPEFLFPPPDCCGIDGYPPCWWFHDVYGTVWGPNIDESYEEYPPMGYLNETQVCYPIHSDPSHPACCGFGMYPPCGSFPASGKSGKSPSPTTNTTVGKSGKSRSLVSTTPTCGNADGNPLAPNANPPCCGFEYYAPCTCDICTGEGCCGVPFFPQCPSGLSGKSGKGDGNYTYTGNLTTCFGAPAPTPPAVFTMEQLSPAQTSPTVFTMEQLSAEVDEAINESFSVPLDPDEDFSFDFDV